jgi:aminobenzoyl-glutamate utilization protein B
MARSPPESSSANLLYTVKERTTSLVISQGEHSSMTTSPSIEAIDQTVEQVNPIIERLASELWQLAELSLEEVKSAQLVMDTLQKEGFTLTSQGTAGVPTAFIAEWGSGTPILGVLAEYDALPGLGNEAVPYQQARKNGITNGHACGHNLLGAGSIGAAIALKNLMATWQIPGTLRLYGCAAEETEGAKVYMARAGLFNDLDAALHWHPGPNTGVMNIRSAAINTLKIEFFGKTAHAGLSPWLGRSALDAAELFAHGINLMREHVEPTARIHYIYENAGEAPNIVPDYAKIRLYVRDIDRVRVEASTAWIKQIAEGAAIATQTRAKVLSYYGLYDILPNNALAERMYTHIARLNVPAYTETEQTFAREIQQNFGVEPQGMATTILPFPDDHAFMGASTDVGDVSWLTPTMGCDMTTMPLGITPHTWPATACHGMNIGLKGAIQAARVLTATGIDILTDAELRQAARAEFASRTSGKPYVSPLPPAIQHPLELPEWLLSAGVKQ